MTSSVKTRSIALALAVAVLSGTPAVAQQGVDSTTAGSTVMDTRRDDGMNWGWLGLIGLAGLAGMRRKHDNNVRVRPSSATL